MKPGVVRVRHPAPAPPDPQDPPRTHDQGGRSHVPTPTTLEIEFGGRTLTLETGKLAGLAGGAVTAPLRRLDGPRDREPLRAPPRARLLPAHRRLRGADVRRRQDPGRLHQARGPRLRGGDARGAPHGPPDPPAVPRGLQGRRPDRHHRPLDGPRERPGHPRHDRRVRRADDQRDPVPGPGRRRARRLHRRRVRPQPDVPASSRTRSSTSSSRAPATRS